MGRPYHIEALKLLQSLIAFNLLPFAVIYPLSLVFNDLPFVLYYGALSVLALDAVIKFFRPLQVRAAAGGPHGADDLAMLKLGDSAICDEIGILQDSAGQRDIGAAWFRLKGLYMERFSYSVSRIPRMLFSKDANAAAKAGWALLLPWKDARDSVIYLFPPILILLWVYKGEFDPPLNPFVFACIAIIAAGALSELVSGSVSEHSRGNAGRQFGCILLYAPFILLKCAIKLVAVRDVLAGEPRPTYGQER